MMFYKLLFLSLLCALSNAQQSPKNCKDHGPDGPHKHGESWNSLDCTSRCKCDNGTIGCVSMCPPFINQPHCTKFKPFRQCCKGSACPEDIKQCSKNETHFSPPWIVHISNQVDGKKSSCVATIINRNTLFTSENCVKGNSVPILKVPKPYPRYDTSQWVIEATKSNTPVSHVVTIKLKNEVRLVNNLHELNLPWHKSMCENVDKCPFYVASYKPTDGTTENIMAKHAAAEKCNLTPAEQGVKCLEIEKYPECPNLDGTSVAVKRGDAFYLAGILLGDPSPKNAQNCDTNRDRYRKYREVCKEVVRKG